MVWFEMPRERVLEMCRAGVALLESGEELPENDDGSMWEAPAVSLS